MKGDTILTYYIDKNYTKFVFNLKTASPIFFDFIFLKSVPIKFYYEENNLETGDKKMIEYHDSKIFHCSFTKMI